MYYYDKKNELQILQNTVKTLKGKAFNKIITCTLNYTSSYKIHYVRTPKYSFTKD